jgi:modification methylase
MNHTVFWGDSRHMANVPDDSVHLVVTSPPYWQLKDYGSPDQIGFHDSYEEYVANLNAVWAECLRVLHSGCRLCVNIGDQFARAAFYGRYKVIPLHEAVIHGCEALGFDYMGAIIWQKSTTMNTSGGGSVMGSFPHPRNGIVKIDYEFILLFKKLGKAPKVSPAQKQGSAMTTKEWNEYFNGHWNFPGERQGDGHIAMFPLELPRRLIRMFSFPDETVLDPFLGSGTTIRAAMDLGRWGVGYEINRDFEEVIRRRLGVEESNLALHDVEFEICPLAPVSVTPVTHLAGNGLSLQVNPTDFRFNSVIGMGDAAKRARFACARGLGTRSVTSCRWRRGSPARHTAARG